MSKTILAEVNGWTPVIDSITKELGLITSAVFGRIWRYCQGEKGVCTASLETIAKELSIDRATVMRHAQKLVEVGYLKDLTPELRNRPHIYADTGKAGIILKIETNEKKETVAESNTKKDEKSGVAGSKPTVAQSNVTVAQDNVTVAESNMKKGSKKESKKQKREEGETTPKEILDPFVNTLADVTGIDIRLKRTRLAGEAVNLIKAGYTAQQIAIIFGSGGNWYKYDWRGKKGERPSLTHIQETIKNLLGHRDGASPPKQGAYTPEEWAALSRQKEKS